MATKKKGLYVTAGEWAKHLRTYGKRKFWKKERARARTTITTKNGSLSV